MPVKQDYKIAPGREAAIVSQITSVLVRSDTGGQGRSPQRTDCSVDRRGTRLAKNMAHLFWHRDGILDLEREPKIY